MSIRAVSPAWSGRRVRRVIRPAPPLVRPAKAISTASEESSRMRHEPGVAESPVEATGIDQRSPASSCTAVGNEIAMRDPRSSREPAVNATTSGREGSTDEPAINGCSVSNERRDAERTVGFASSAIVTLVDVHEINAAQVARTAIRSPAMGRSTFTKRAMDRHSTSHSAVRGTGGAFWAT